MDLIDFKKIATKVEVNTCNGWGFCGYFGNEYTYGKYKMRIAKYGYRHNKPTEYNGYYYNGVAIEKKDFIKKISKLKGKK